MLFDFREWDSACYDFYSVCLCCDKLFSLVSEIIRLLLLLRISSGENNQKSKRSDPSKISLVKAEGALEILGAWAWGFFIFVSQIFVQISFLIYLGLKQFRYSIYVSHTMRVTTFIPYVYIATDCLFLVSETNQFSDLSRSETISAFNLRKWDSACYDFYSVCLWSDKLFFLVSETIRLLLLLRISSGENNQKPKRSDPSKISLVKAVGALEILGSQAWGFFYFRKSDIRANQFSDLSRSETI